MSDREADAEAGWVIAAAGEQVTRKFVAPDGVEGWQERPWVTLRPLTAREALRRESIGVRDEYQVGADGETTLVRRTYDLEAMAELDLGCCLVDFLLPVRDDDGALRAVRMSDGEPGAGGSLLDRLPPALATWLLEAIESVNMRRPEDATVVSEAKKGCAPRRTGTCTPECSRTRS